MALSDEDKKKIAEEVKKDLKEKHADWDETKLEAESKKQSGRKIKDAEKKQAQKERLDKTKESLKGKDDNKSLSDEDLTKKANEQIAKEDFDAQLEKLKKAESEALDKYTDATIERRNFENPNSKKGDSLTKDEKEMLALYRKNKSA